MFGSEEREELALAQLMRQLDTLSDELRALSRREQEERITIRWPWLNNS
jgi:hypothetical protein